MSKSKSPIPIKNLFFMLCYAWNVLSIKDTVKYAIAMSIVTITHEETINPNMSEDFVNGFIKDMNWIEG